MWLVTFGTPYGTENLPAADVANGQSKPSPELASVPTLLGAVLQRVLATLRTKREPLVAGEQSLRIRKPPWTAKFHRGAPKSRDSLPPRA